MKRNFNFLYVIGLITTLFLSGCGGDEDSNPKPTGPTTSTEPVQASFTQDRKIIQRFEKVTFTNTSTNAVRYEWDFGNMGKYTTKEATVQFLNYETTTVKLTAYGADGSSSVATSTVSVGKPYLTSIVVHSVAPTDIYGKTWDPSDAPDITVNFKPKSYSQFPQPNLPPYMNVTTFPITFDYSSNPIEIYDMPYQFDILDDDVFYFQGMWSFDVNFNPNLDKDYNTGKGVVRLNQIGFAMDIYFEMRY